MTRIIAAVVALILVVTTVAMVPTGGVAMPATERSNATEITMAPGEHFGAVLGVQRAEVTGDLEHRAFRIQLSRVASDEARAGVASENLNEVEAKLGKLESRKQALAEARKNGSISNGSHDARMVVIAAELSNLQTQLDLIETTSDGLPPELVEEKGIDTSAIRTLRENASTLTGPEVAAIAKTISGPGDGPPIAIDSVPVTAGPQSDLDPSIDRNETEVPPGGSPIGTDSPIPADDDDDGEDDDPLTTALG